MKPKLKADLDITTCKLENEKTNTLQNERAVTYFTS